MSFDALTCLVGFAIFHRIKVSQLMNWNAPLQRARRDDRNGPIICDIWSSESKDIKSTLKPTLEGST
jgi:hypothetical protein